MTFHQIGGFYVLMFGGGAADEGECAPHAWRGPINANIDLNFDISWADPDPVNINLCAPLLAA